MKKIKQKTWNRVGYVYTTLVVVIITIGFINNNRDINAEIKSNADIKSLHNEYNSKGEKFLTMPKTNRETEIEKMQEMINFYGSPIDNDGLLNFYLESRKAGIDAVIPFCLSVIETQIATKGIGTKLKNPCNWGIYGKNRKSYTRYRDGLDMCYKAYTRPQYRNVRYIYQTSVGGNMLAGKGEYAGEWSKGDKIFASSKENHIHNMINCVQEFKPQYTKEELLHFDFRIN